jgi:tight adherence protein B
MLLLGVVFWVTLSVVFGLALVLMRPSAKQSTMDRRIAEVLGRTSSEEASERAADLMARDEEKPGWLRKIFPNSKLLQRLERLVLQSQVDTSATVVVEISAGLTIGVFLLVYYLSSAWPIALVSASVAGYLPTAYLRWKRKRRLEAFNNVLPDCVETCARALRAGHSIVAALEIVAEHAEEPAKTEFNAAFKKHNYGLSLREALMQMLDRVPSPDLQVMVTGILVQKDTGGNLAEILDRLVFVIRERFRIEREIKIHTAQGRLTGWILCLLPLVMMLAINLLNPGYSRILFHDPTGKKMLYAGLGLLVLGVLVMRQIIRGIEV